LGIPDTPWLAAARRHLGASADPVHGNSPEIKKFYALYGGDLDPNTYNPFCAIGLGAFLVEAGYSSTKSALARSYLTYGTKLDGPKIGCIVVFARQDALHGHVSIVEEISTDGAQIKCLGANQNHAVAETWYSTAKVLGYRWPPEPKKTVLQPNGLPMSAILPHILVLSTVNHKDALEQFSAAPHNKTTHAIVDTDGVVHLLAPTNDRVNGIPGGGVSVGGKTLNDVSTFISVENDGTSPLSLNQVMAMDRLVYETVRDRPSILEVVTKAELIGGVSAPDHFPIERYRSIFTQVKNGCTHLELPAYVGYPALKAPTVALNSAQDVPIPAKAAPASKSLAERVWDILTWFPGQK
jgi:uncharacterized protein (TIGR02594 family)